MIRHLQLETTNVCNGKCVFCPHDRFKKLGTMDDGLYRKIIEDAAQYDLLSFSPVGTGEAFCDPKIMARIRLARELMPHTVIRIYTNGSLVTREIVDELAEIGGLDIEVNISLNGQDRERRRELMGLDDYDHVRTIIGYMFPRLALIKVSTVWHPVYTIEQTKEFLKIPGTTLIRFQSFAGNVYRYRRTKPTSCLGALEYLTVLWNGRVSLCCFDAFGEQDLGDLNRQTIEEVLRNERRLEYVKAHQEGRGQEMPLCDSCTEGA